MYTAAACAVLPYLYHEEMQMGSKEAEGDPPMEVLIVLRRKTVTAARPRDQRDVEAWRQAEIAPFSKQLVHGTNYLQEGRK